MTQQRIFNSTDFMQPSDDEPIRSVITRSDDAAVVAWFVKPGQRLAGHVHPQGQDTWILRSGTGLYQLDKDGSTQVISAGDVVVAHTGAVHGVYNNGHEPLVIVSVVSPAESGYTLV